MKKNMVFKYFIVMSLLVLMMTGCGEDKDSAKTTETASVTSATEEKTTDTAKEDKKDKSTEKASEDKTEDKKVADKKDTAKKSTEKKEDKALEKTKKAEEEAATEKKTAEAKSDTSSGTSSGAKSGTSSSGSSNSSSSSSSSNSSSGSSSSSSGKSSGSSGSGKEQKTTEAPKPSGTTECQHNWVWKTHTETVHHDAVTKQEPYYGEEWDEPVYKTVCQCIECGVTAPVAEELSCTHYHWTVTEIVDHYEHHDADILGYDTVVVKEAYDEQVEVKDYQYCSKCGARKQMLTNPQTYLMVIL